MRLEDAAIFWHNIYIKAQTLYIQTGGLFGLNLASSGIYYCRTTIWPFKVSVIVKVDDFI